LGIMNVYVRDKFAESTMLAPIAVPKWWRARPGTPRIAMMENIFSPNDWRPWGRAIGGGVSME
jgi:hypothetical protein